VERIRLWRSILSCVGAGAQSRLRSESLCFRRWF